MDEPTLSPNQIMITLLDDQAKGGAVARLHVCHSIMVRLTTTLDVDVLQLSLAGYRLGEIQPSPSCFSS